MGEVQYKTVFSGGMNVIKEGDQKGEEWRERRGMS